MLVKINGNMSEIADGSSLQDLVRARNLPLKGVIIELNGEIIPRERREGRKMSPGDTVEIVRIMGGG